jgi:hypothetical protein
MLSPVLDLFKWVRSPATGTGVMGEARQALESEKGARLLAPFEAPATRGGSGAGATRALGRVPHCWARARTAILHDLARHAHHARCARAGDCACAPQARCGSVTRP